jgi:hypothetical protein
MWTKLAPAGWAGWRGKKEKDRSAAAGRSDRRPFVPSPPGDAGPKAAPMLYGQQGFWTQKDITKIVQSGTDFARAAGGLAPLWASLPPPRCGRRVGSGAAARRAGGKADRALVGITVDSVECVGR